MANYSAKLWTSTSADTWPGWLSTDDQARVEQAYGVSISQAAWLQLEHIVERFAWTLGDEQQAVDLSEARKRIHAVLAAAANLQSKIELAGGYDMNQAATRVADDYWDRVALHDSTYDFDMKQIDARLAMSISDDADRLEIMASIKSRFPRPRPAEKLIQLLREYSEVMVLIKGDLARDTGVSVGSALDAFIIETTEWAKLHGYPPGVAQNSDVDNDRTSQFVRLLQCLIWAAPEEHRPETLLDSGMADRINRTRRKHKKRQAAKEPKSEAL